MQRHAGADSCPRPGSPRTARAPCRAPPRRGGKSAARRGRRSAAGRARRRRAVSSCSSASASAVAHGLQPGARSRRAWRAPCPRSRARGAAGRARPASLGLGSARLRELHRLAVPRRDAQLVGHARSARRAASAGAPVAAKPSAARRARRERIVAVAPQLEHRGQPALRGGDRASGRVARRAASSRQARAGLGELAGQLGAARRSARSASRRRCLIGALGPQLERQPAGLGGVAVGVDGLATRPPHAGAPSRARSPSRAPSQCVATSRLGAPAVSIASAIARCSVRRRIHGTSRVQRLARERVAEARRTDACSMTRPRSMQLGDALVARTASRRGPGRRSPPPPPPPPPPCGPPSESSDARIRTASRTVSGTGISLARASSRPRRPARQRAARRAARPRAPRRRTAVPWVRSWIAGTSDGAGAPPSTCVSRCDVVGTSSGPQRQLLQRARAPQLVAQPAQPCSRGRPSER